MVLSVMREYKANVLKKKHVEQILRAIENFHFVFTAVTSQRSSGGISQMYASCAKRLTTEPLQEKKTEELKELNEALGGKPFVQKRDILTKAGVTLDEITLKAKDWGRSEISERTKYLANYAYETAWKF